VPSVWLIVGIRVYEQAMPQGAPLPPQEVHVPKRKRTCAAGPSLEAQPGPAANGLSTVPKVRLGSQHCQSMGTAKQQCRSKVRCQLHNLTQEPNPRPSAHGSST
jgi:hypothetical protein